MVEGPNNVEVFPLFAVKFSVSIFFFIKKVIIYLENETLDGEEVRKDESTVGNLRDKTSHDVK